MLTFDGKQATILFLPLFVYETSWVHDVDDESYTNIVVKVSVSPNDAIEGILDIDHADVFSISAYFAELPPQPKVKILLSVIRLAVQKRTGKRADFTDNAILIYGGKVITTKNATNHNNYNK